MNDESQPAVANAGVWVVGRPGRYRQDGERVFDSRETLSKLIP